jgi:hypothetical protein
VSWSSNSERPHSETLRIFLPFGLAELFYGVSDEAWADKPPSRGIGFEPNHLGLGRVQVAKQDTVGDLDGHWTTPERRSKIEGDPRAAHVAGGGLLLEGVTVGVSAPDQQRRALLFSDVPALAFTIQVRSSSHSC